MRDLIKGATHLLGLLSIYTTGGVVLRSLLVLTDAPLSFHWVAAFAMLLLSFRIDALLKALEADQ